MMAGSSKRSVTSAMVGRCVSSRPKTLPSDDRSMPAQNARPSPVTTIAATSSSALARSKADSSSSAMVTVKAFRLSGRLSHRVRMPSATSYRSVS